MNNQQRAENAIKWIETLLKTRMKQGKGELGNSKRGYCCLGVGCKVLGVNYDPDEASDKDFSESVGLWDEEGRAYDSEQDKPISAWVLGHEALTALNDDVQFTFNQIAKRLISQTDEYFKPEVAKLIKKHFEEKQ